MIIKSIDKLVLKNIIILIFESFCFKVIAHGKRAAADIVKILNFQS